LIENRENKCEGIESKLRDIRIIQGRFVTVGEAAAVKRGGGGCVHLPLYICCYIAFFL
jgi:hypothetical protein